MRWKRGLRWRVWLLGLMLVAPLAALEGLYLHTLSRVPTLPSKSARLSLPEERLRLRWWMSLEQPQVTYVQPVWSWTAAVYVLNLFMRTSDYRDNSPMGLALADSVARQWSSELEQQGAPRLRGPERLALTVWFTRHWSAEDLVMHELHHRSLVQQHDSVFDAARSVFGKEWAELDLASIALLKAFINAPSRCDPWCALERSLRKRNSLLRAAHANADITMEELEEALETRPLLAPRPKHWASCENSRLGDTWNSVTPL